jgi:hypothetical protein
MNTNHNASHIDLRTKGMFWEYEQIAVLRYSLILSETYYVEKLLNVFQEQKNEPLDEIC